MTINALEHFCSQNGELQLLQFSVSDAEALFALIDSNREHLSQFDDDTSAKYPTLGSVRQSIESPKNPNRLRLGIWLGNELTGTINVTPITSPNTASIGYWIGQQYIRRRIASNALRATIRYVAREKGYKTLVADTHKDNIASQMVLHRAGFKITHQLGDTFHWVLKP